MKLLCIGFFSLLFLVFISFFYSYLNFFVGNNLNKFMSDFWVAFNNITLFLTLAVVSYYTYVTHKLRQTAEEHKELTVRPILVLTEAKPEYNYLNRGSAIAINPCVLVWQDNKFSLPNKDLIPNGIAVNDRYTFQAVEIKSVSEVKKIFHMYEKIINKIIKMEDVAVLCVYRDIYGNYLYSFSKGENHEYLYSFEHGIAGRSSSKLT